MCVQAHACVRWCSCALRGGRLEAAGRGGPVCGAVSEELPVVAERRGNPVDLVSTGFRQPHAEAPYQGSLAFVWLK